MTMLRPVRKPARKPRAGALAAQVDAVVERDPRQRRRGLLPPAKARAGIGALTSASDAPVLEQPPTEPPAP